MQTPDSSGSESEQEEMPRITLEIIPTLRYLYKNGTLKQAGKQRFPFRKDFLDRVSL